MRSSLSASLLCLLSASPFTQAAYQLSRSYQGTNFFNNFNFFTDLDPTHGFVDYVSQADAQSRGLISVSNGVARMGVDSTNRYSNTAEGRRSVRIESKLSYTYGLFIADIKHMPGSICGTWPAFWTLGSGTWPGNGEIDIIEGVSRSTTNSMVLHTEDSCSVSGSGQTGAQQGTQCSVAFGTAGCAVQGGPFGDSFNSIGGGVYVMEWKAAAIKMWFFPRNAIPASIRNGAPKPAKFGTPLANFQGTCDLPSQFSQHRLVFNTAFCGDWAGNAYDTNACPSTPGASPMQSCMNYVANSPAAFRNAYWEINSVKIYKNVVNRPRRSLPVEAEVNENQNHVETIFRL